MDSFTDYTGLNSLTDHLVGKCRVDFCDYTISPTFDSTTALGTISGTPSFTIGRDVAEVVAGTPEGTIQAYGIKDKVGFKVALDEFQIAKLGKQLGLDSSTNYVAVATPMSKTWKFGGNLAIKNFSARVSKKMADGTYLVMTIHRGYFKPDFPINMAAGVNTRDCEFVGMIDVTRDGGDNMATIVQTATSPW